MESRKILLVDDDLEDRFIVEEALRTVRPDITICFAQNSTAAFQMLEDSFNEKELPSLVVLDVNMPKMSGPEILSTLKNDLRFKAIPVIIFSTSVNPYEREKCVQLGAHSYITKPISYSESLEIAKKFIEVCEVKTIITH
jgi:CheY-like chemotaxis protein